MRLELIAYVLKKMARYKIQKRKLWKRVVRFIRGRGWEPRKVAILVDGARNAKKKKRGSEKAIQNDLTIEIADQEEEAQSLPNGLSQKTKNKKNKKLFDAEASATDLIDLPLPPDETIEEELQHNGDLNGSLLDDPVEMKKKKRRAKKESTDSAGGLK